jgi:hypothetical protein
VSLIHLQQRAAPMPPTEDDMKRTLAAFLIAVTFCAAAPAAAQEAEATQEADLSAFQAIMEKDLPPETMSLALELVRVSGISRTFDELLPNIADQAKNNFIRANPQMQLGIIELVDRTALTLVSRRKELDESLAKVWASGFTSDELQELVDFYKSDTGKKFADLHPQLLGVQMAAAQSWADSVGTALTEKVANELRDSIAAEGQALQSGADVVAEPPAPAPAQ